MVYMKKAVGILIVCVVMIGVIVVVGVSGENVDENQSRKSVCMLVEEHGEWTVTGEEKEMNKTIILTGNLTILNGGKLTLKNVTLMMNSTYDGQYHITVNSGGYLKIMDNSIVTAYNHSHRFLFNVHLNSEFQMENSELRYCGYSNQYPGLVIRTNAVAIKNCVISNNAYGLSFFNSSASIVVGCVIFNNYYDGIYTSNSVGITVTDCNIFSNNVGISLNYPLGDNSIENCNIHNNSESGVYIVDGCSDNSITKCSFTENGNAIRLDNTLLISIAGCVFLENAHAIYLNTSSNNIIRDCNMEHNAEAVFLENSSNNTITNCDMRNNVDGIYIRDAKDTYVSNCRIQNNINGILLSNSSNTIIANYSGIGNEYGISIKYFSENTQITNASISNNSFGVFSECTTVGISKSNINNNTEWGVFGTEQVDATHNYWGSDNGPGGNAPGDGDKVNENVIYAPYLTKYPYEKPEISINLPEENTLLSGNITIEGLSNAYVSDGVHWVNVSVDDPTFTEPTLMVNNITSWYSFWNSTLYPDGTHTIYARAFDGVSYSEIVSVNITTDNIPPTKPGKPIHYDEVPEGYDNDLTLEFSWDISTDVNFSRYDIYVSVNGGGFVYDHNVTTNSTTVDGIDGNNYSIKVVAVDTVGLPNESESSDIITCDMTAPTVTITDLPQIINTTSFTLHWTTTDMDICYYEVRLNEGSWVNVGLNTSYVFTNLSEGENTLYVRGTDKAYNTGTPDSVVIIVDTAAPTVTVVECSHTLINEASVGETFYLNITYNEDMNVTGMPEVIFTPQLSTTLIWPSGEWNGNTVYRLQYIIADINEEQAGVNISVSDALDAAGNAQTAYTESDAFDVDTIAPTVTAVVEHSHPLINEASASEIFYLNITYSEKMDIMSVPAINFTLQPNGTLTWSNGAWDGTTIYRLQYIIADINEEQTGVNISVSDALDVAGNTQTAYTEPDAFDVDTAAPVVTITIEINSINTTFLTINWTIGVNVTDISHYEINLNDGNWTNVETSTGHTFSSLSEGSNTLYVRGVDLTNNTYPTSITITVDTLGPTIIIYEESTSINKTSFTVSWYSADAEYYEISTDNETWVDVGTNINYEFKNLSDGNNTLYVRGTDDMNNPAVVFIVIAVDRVAPVVTIMNISQTIKVTYFVMNWTGEADIEYCKVSMDGENWTYADSNTGHNFSLTEGENKLYVHAVDLSGNVGESENIVITVDITPPVVVVSDHIINTKSFTLHWNTTDTDITYYEVSNDSINWTEITNTSYLFTNLSVGNNTLYVRGIDNAGNVGETVSVNVSVDMTKPVVVIPEQDVKTDKDSFTISWSGNDTDDLQYYEVSMDGSTWVQVDKNATSYTFTNLSEGENTLYVRAVDNANNTDTVIITVTVEIPVPPEEINWMLYIIIIVIPVVVIVVLVVLRKKGILKRKEKTEKAETGKEEGKEEEAPKEEEKKGFLKRKKGEVSKEEGKEKKKRGFLKRKKTEVVPEKTEKEGKEKEETETPLKEEMKKTEEVPEKTGIIPEEAAPVKSVEKPEGAPDCFGTYDNSEACKGCSLSEGCKKATG